MSKFPDKKTRKLYMGTSDDEVGSSSEGIGWAGLYFKRKRQGGHIIVENCDGFVERFTYETTEALSEAWAQMERTLDRSEPEEEDWLIFEPGKGFIYVSQKGSTTAPEQFSGRDEALAWLKERMAQDSFFPDVWVVTERGDHLRLEMAQ